MTACRDMTYESALRCTISWYDVRVCLTMHNIVIWRTSLPYDAQYRDMTYEFALRCTISWYDVRVCLTMHNTGTHIKCVTITVFSGEPNEILRRSRITLWLPLSDRGRSAASFHLGRWHPIKTQTCLARNHVVSWISRLHDIKCIKQLSHSNLEQ
jgi:hypothetical protein